MKRCSTHWLAALGVVVLAVPAALADFEVKAPDGRRILLKDDKTWSYIDAEAAPGDKPKGGEQAAKADKPKQEGEAVLSLERRTPGNRICRFHVKLVNNLPYEIRSLVPEFSVYRANGVMYDSIFQGFAFLKPGDAQQREVRFNGIACEDITRVQVGGGDRCEMGELDKFSSVKGQCLERVRVVASDIVRFDK
jgi:hypothetical protein